ncbi:N-acetylmuramoyl-L-alanine amidase [Paenibacillus sediminis]|uniref:N-acetylmuramoyl-L-alanine amidase n=1 Tax=Paenibacillus sediminis TaxID=664909 RepID=A0ABS4GZT2_9BACL|nr:N-acetylmuramoyl-L-alanine amidase [Paenibacillus sediminis]MBP1935721.1 hypothetical protein [Paenibacillus sediminis]
MSYQGFVIHQSTCSSINGKGYDFWIGINGNIIPAASETDKRYIHICLEGDFSHKINELSSDQKEQFFQAGKLIQRLADRYRLTSYILLPHDASCPGAFFPWNELVISPLDGYH